jgi:hypothetical protein
MASGFLRVCRYLVLCMNHGPKVEAGAGDTLLKLASGVVNDKAVGFLINRKLVFLVPHV